MNIIECAIERETLASAQYEKLAANTVEEELREIFTLLAAAEREHLKKLENLKQEVARHGSWELTLEQEACPAKPLPQEDALRAEETVSRDGYLDITRAEEESIVFYERLAGKAENPALRNLCLELADEERRHLRKIEYIYDFVESPKNYLAWGEFSNLQEY